MFNGIGSPNGPGLQPFGRWFRYPAGFSADALDVCFEVARPRRGMLVVDPFVGVGTIGVHAASLGLDCLGIEAHPLIAELAALKFSRPPAPRRLVVRATEMTANLKAAPIAAEHALVVRSFEPEPLAKLVALRQQIADTPDDPWHLHLKWCLLGALRDCASVKVGWPYQRPSVKRTPRIADPCRAFVRRAQRMAEDLSTPFLSLAPVASIHHGDARKGATWQEALAGRIADMVVTSPPYLNNFDYADATRLELYFWGIARSWAEMIATVRSGMVVATTQQAKRAMAVNAEASFAALCPVASRTTRALTEELGIERGRRPRGKEYDQVLPVYFLDLARVLVNVRAHTMPGALIALVLGDSAPYGIYIDTPGILACTAEDLGFERVSTSSLRQRGLRWHTNGTRHSVALTEQIVVLRSPGIL